MSAEDNWLSAEDNFLSAEDNLFPGSENLFATEDNGFTRAVGKVTSTDNSPVGEIGETAVDDTSSGSVLTGIPVTGQSLPARLNGVETSERGFCGGPVKGLSTSIIETAALREEATNVSDILDTQLLARQSKLVGAKRLLERTKTLFDDFGSPELKAAHARFGELMEAMNADEVRLVVIGEFSRGKSSLVNALLGIRLLPTAQQATTAINTFIRQLPAGRTEPYLEIHFKDGRPSQEIAWTHDEVLEQWGTELDESHRDARTDIDWIDAFTDHRLLRLGLCVIDTPGLQSVLEHHEAITRRAIARSHVALWVQSADQLGGTETEWNFMKSTIRANFRKILTVINMWDRVLDPNEARERETPQEQRTAKALEFVRNIFRNQFKHLTPGELSTLTDSRHLMGVSALWARDPDEARRRASNIDALAERLSQMLASGEAMDEIYFKPLKQLEDVQATLRKHVEAELTQLDSNATVADRLRELERLTLDIELLDAERLRETQTSDEEHLNACKSLQDDVNTQLVAPLVKLKHLVDDTFTESYVEQQVQSDLTHVTLPLKVESAMQQIDAELGAHWQAIKDEIRDVLEGLRSSYIGRMAQHVYQIEARLGDVQLSLPQVDLDMNVDFGALEEHRQRANELRDQLEEAEEEMHRIEDDLDGIGGVDERRQIQAQMDRDRYARRLDAMGPPPLPTLRRERVKVSDWGSGFLWLSDTYEVVEVTDDSNVRHHQAEATELKNRIKAEEASLRKLAEEEAGRAGQVKSLSIEKKQKEREAERVRRKAEAAEREMGRKRDLLVRDSVRRLRSTTLLKIDEASGFLTNGVMGVIQAAFTEQRRLLEQCVVENVMEPLNAKRAQKEAVQELLAKGKAEIDGRKSALKDAAQALDAVHAETADALDA